MKQTKEIIIAECLVNARDHALCFMHIYSLNPHMGPAM